MQDNFNAKKIKIANVIFWNSNVECVIENMKVDDLAAFPIKSTGGTNLSKAL